MKPRNEKAPATAIARAYVSNQPSKKGDKMNTTITPEIVNFHDAQLLTVLHNDEPHVSLRSVSEGLGLNWPSQYKKLKKNMSKFGCCHMTIPSRGGMQEAIMAPLRKLNGWLFSINPEKVRSDLREKVIAYQEECFVVLHDYWTKGEAVNPRISTKADRTPLKEAVNMLVRKAGNLNHAEAWRLIHQQFGVDSVEDLTTVQIPKAVEYAHKIMLEGELLPPEPEQPAITAIDPLGMEDLPAGRYLVARIDGRTIVQKLEQHAIVPLDHVNAFRRDMNQFMQFGGELLSRMRILHGEANLERLAEPLIR